MKHACLFLVAVAMSTTTLAADDVLLRDDFSGTSAWSAADRETTVVTQANGKLRFANSAEEYSAELTRPVRVPSASAYRLSFTVSEVSHAGDKTYYGIGLRAPDGDQVGFMLAPEGQLRVHYWHDGAWASPPLKWTNAPSMKTGAGAVNQVTIDRDAGRFYLSINGQPVAATDVVDFMPSEVVLFGNDRIVADFDDLVITRTGVDSRMARMLLLAPVPGQAVLKQDDFNRSMKEKVRATALKKDDHWIVGSNRDRDVGINYERGVYFLDKKTDGDTWVYAGDVTDPRRIPGYSVGAKVAYTRVSENGCGGVALMGKPKKDDMGEPLLVACYRPTGNAMQLWYYPQDNSEWKELVNVSTGALRDGMNDVRLVVDGGKILVFLNGEYQGDASMPSDFEFVGLGVYVDSKVGIEVDDFDAREI